MPHDEKNPGKKPRHETEEMAFITDRMIVQTAGTKQLLTEVYGGQTITIWADNTNAGRIYVGNNSLTANNCMILTPGSSYSIDLSTDVPTHKYIKVFIDSATSGDSVRYTLVGGGI